MRLTAFSVSNYRSIIKADRLPVSDFTVLIGPNNQGKSNLLYALVTCLQAIGTTKWVRSGRSLRALGPRPSYGEEWSYDYDWERDYPLKLQDAHPDGRSSFTAEFELTPDEQADFRDRTQIALSTHLKIRVHLGHDRVSFEFLKQGRSKDKFIAAGPQIVEFVRDRISCLYVQSMRPSRLTLAIVEDMVAAELSLLEENPEYAKLGAAMTAMEGPKLQAIADRLRTTVSQFVSGVDSVEVRVEKRERAFRRRQDCSIWIDDGDCTDLHSKGDGVKSLTAIAVMQHTTRSGEGGKSTILAVEEPESHLHPGAIHGLRGVLEQIAETNQVIISTHSPVLVDRQHVGRNIIVRSSRAASAKSLQEVRSVLGMQRGDNLDNTELVVLVEGDSDVRILKRWLGLLSPALAKAIEAERLVIEPMSGGSSLGYHLQVRKSHVYNVYAVLDNDQAGKAAISQAVAAGLLDDPEYTLLHYPNFRESDIEDFVDAALTSQAVTLSGIDPGVAAYRGSRAKWTDRARAAASASGKPWDKRLERKIKTAVAQQVEQAAITGLKTAGKPLIDKIATDLEAML